MEGTLAEFNEDDGDGSVVPAVACAFEVEPRVEGGSLEESAFIVVLVEVEVEAGDTIRFLGEALGEASNFTMEAVDGGE